MSLSLGVKPPLLVESPSLNLLLPSTQVASMPGRALECFERASTAQAKQGSPWHAGKHMEVCGELSKAIGNEPSVSAGYYRQACSLFIESGKTIAGGHFVVETLCAHYPSF